VASLQTLRESTEASLADLAEKVQRQLAEPALDTDRLQRKAEDLFKGLEGQLQNTLNGLEQKGGRQATAQLQKVTEDLLERSAKQLEKQASDTVEASGRKVRASHADLAEEARKQIEGLIEVSLQSLAKATEESRNDLAETARRNADHAMLPITAGAPATGSLQTSRESTEASFADLAEKVQRRLADTERLQCKAEDLFKDFEGQLQNKLNDLEQKGELLSTQLQKLTEDLVERSAKEFQKQAGDTAEELGDRVRAWEAGLASQATAQLEASVQVSLSSLTKATEESRREVAETARHNIDETMRCVTGAAESALGRFQTLGENMEARFQTAASDSQKRLEQLSASHTEEIRRNAEGLLQNFQNQLASTLNGLQDKSTKQLTTQLQNLSDELVERSAKEFQKQASDTAEELGDRVRAWEAGLANQAVPQLEASLKVSLSSLTKATEESRSELAEAARRSADEAARSINAAAGSAVASLQTLRESTEASLADLAEKVQRQLAEPALDTDRLQRKAEDLFKGLEGQLQNTLNGLEQKGGRQATAQLQKVTEDLLERSAKQLEKQASDTVEASGRKVRASHADLAEEARKQIEGLIEVSLQSLAKATEESRNDLAETARRNADDAMLSITAAAESALGRFQTLGEKVDAGFQTAEDSRKRLEELATSNTERIQRKADTLLKDFESQLQNTLNAFEHKGTKAISDRLQKTTSDLVERSAQHLQERAKDSEEKFSKIRADLVEEASEQVRSLAHSSLKSLTKAAEQSCRELRQMSGEIVTQSRELEAQHERSLKTKGDSLERQIQNVAQSALERLRNEGNRVKPAPAQRPIGSLVALCLAAIAPTALFIYLSTRPVTRLQDEPPATFFDSRQGLSSKQAATAERLARAYWDWASQHLQRKYPFGTALPDEPPPGFEVDGRDFPKGAEGDLVRHRYWRKLREVWGQPQAWETSNGWNRP